MAPTSHHNPVIRQDSVPRRGRGAPRLGPSQMPSPFAQPAVPAPPPAQEPSAKSANPGSPKAPTTKERKPGVNDGAIDIHSDHATLGVDGNATLKGNVIVRQ